MMLSLQIPPALFVLMMLSATSVNQNAQLVSAAGMVGSVRSAANAQQQQRIRRRVAGTETKPETEMENKTENLPCTTESCVCIVKDSKECPDWMNDTYNPNFNNHLRAINCDFPAGWAYNPKYGNFTTADQVEHDGKLYHDFMICAGAKNIELLENYTPVCNEHEMITEKASFTSTFNGVTYDITQIMECPTTAPSNPTPAPTTSPTPSPTSASSPPTTTMSPAPPVPSPASPTTTPSSPTSSPSSSSSSSSLNKVVSSTTMMVGSMIVAVAFL